MRTADRLVATCLTFSSVLIIFYDKVGFGEFKFDLLIFPVVLAVFMRECDSRSLAELATVAALILLMIFPSYLRHPNLDQFNYISVEMEKALAVIVYLLFGYIYRNCHSQRLGAACIVISALIILRSLPTFPQYPFYKLYGLNSVDHLSISRDLLLLYSLFLISVKKDQIKMFLFVSSLVLLAIFVVLARSTFFTALSMFLICIFYFRNAWLGLAGVAITSVYAVKYVAIEALNNSRLADAVALNITGDASGHLRLEQILFGLGQLRDIRTLMFGDRGGAYLHFGGPGNAPHNFLSLFTDMGLIGVVPILLIYIRLARLRYTRGNKDFAIIFAFLSINLLAFKMYTWQPFFFYYAFLSNTRRRKIFTWLPSKTAATDRILA